MVRDLVGLEGIFEAFPASARNVLAPVERYGLLGARASHTELSPGMNASPTTIGTMTGRQEYRG